MDDTSVPPSRESIPQRDSNDRKVISPPPPILVPNSPFTAPNAAQNQHLWSPLFSFGITPSIWRFQEPNQSATPSSSQSQNDSYFSPACPYVWRDPPVQPSPAPGFSKMSTSVPSSDAPDVVKDCFKDLFGEDTSPQKTVQAVSAVSENPIQVPQPIGPEEDGPPPETKPLKTAEIKDPLEKPELKRVGLGTWSDIVKTTRPPRPTAPAGAQDVDDEILLWDPKSSLAATIARAEKNPAPVPAKAAVVEEKKPKPVAAPSDEKKKAPAPMTKKDSYVRARAVLPQALPPFFGSANTNPETIVVGTPLLRSFTTERLLQDRLSKLKAVANRGYGVVPITNSFTQNSRTKTVEKKFLQDAPMPPPQLDLTPPSSPESDENDDVLNHDIVATPIRKQSTKNHAPPSPTLPTEEELKTKDLILFQIGFASGRQGLFQGVSVSRSGEQVADMLGEYIVLNQDDGVDLGVLRAFEPIDQLVSRIPEVPFMRIIRRARPGEIERLELKAREEAYMLQTTHHMLKHQSRLAHMKVQSCEFQYDRNKMVVYADFTQRVEFTEFVKSLHATCETEFGYQARIFIQRRFLGSRSDEYFSNKV